MNVKRLEVDSEKARELAAIAGAGGRVTFDFDRGSAAVNGVDFWRIGPVEKRPGVFILSEDLFQPKNES